MKFVLQIAVPRSVVAGVAREVALGFLASRPTLFYLIYIVHFHELPAYDCTALFCYGYHYFLFAFYKGRCELNEKAVCGEEGSFLR